MMNYGLLNTETRSIDNAIVWDGVSLYTPPDGYEVIFLPDGVWMGWTLSEDGAWLPPPEVANPEPGEPNVIAP